MTREHVENVLYRLNRLCGGLVPTRPSKAPAKISLRAINAKVEIAHHCGRVVVEQTYTNLGSKALEVKYVFPLEADAAVCGFEARIGGKVVKGVVQGKEKARQTYQDAVQNQQAAALLEKKGADDNIFICEVGNLLPNETCVVRITYVTELESEGPSTRFVLPMPAARKDSAANFGTAPVTVAPVAGALSQSQIRQMSGAEQLAYMIEQSKAQAKAEEEKRKAVEAEAAARRTTAPSGVSSTQAKAVCDLSIVADVQMPSRITKVVAAAPGHKMKTVYDGANRKILRLSSKVTLDREFVLLIDQEDPYTTRALAEDYDPGMSSFRLPPAALRAAGQSAGQSKPRTTVQAAEEGATAGAPQVKGGEQSRVVQLTFNREFAEPDTDMYCEIVFLVDVSGSMAGSRIDQTKETLQIFLNSLPTNCIFNIISFTRRYQALFERSTEYNDQTLERAQRFVRGLVAQGGTEIFNPLKHVLTSAPVTGYPRQVFLLTDGEVRNTDDIVRMAGQHSGSTRVFTFGIGREASVSLCKGIARKTRGACELVRDSSKIGEQVMRAITSALQPPLCGLAVDWGAVKAASDTKAFRQVPARAPPVYPGRQFVYACGVNTDSTAIAKEKAKNYGSIDAKAGDSPTKCDLKLTSTHNHDDTSMSVSLNYNPENTRKGTLLHTLAARARIREIEELSHGQLSKKEAQEVRSLGLKYNLASSETSFVAVLKAADDDKKAVRKATAGKTTKQLIVSAPGQGDLHEVASTYTSGRRRQKRGSGSRSGGRSGRGGMMKQADFGRRMPQSAVNSSLNFSASRGDRGITLSKSVSTSRSSRMSATDRQGSRSRKAQRAGGGYGGGMMMARRLSKPKNRKKKGSPRPPPQARDERRGEDLFASFGAPSAAPTGAAAPTSETAMLFDVLGTAERSDPEP